MSVPELLHRAAELQLQNLCAGRNRDQSMNGGFVLPVAETDGFSLHVHGNWGQRPVARLRYLPELGQWTLLQVDDAGRWRACLSIGPQLNIARLLQFLDADPFRLFWP